MHSSDEEKSELSAKAVGLGEGRSFTSLDSVEKMSTQNLRGLDLVEIKGFVKSTREKSLNKKKNEVASRFLFVKRKTGDKLEFVSTACSHTLRVFILKSN